MRRSSNRSRSTHGHGEAGGRRSPGQNSSANSRYHQMPQYVLPGIDIYGVQQNPGNMTYAVPQHFNLQQGGAAAFPPSSRQNRRDKSASSRRPSADDVLQVTLTRGQLENLAISSRQGRNTNGSPTVWFNHLKGDVNIPEICVFSIANACKFNETGCDRLHAKCPLQWQFKKDGHWYNFREFHSKELEESFQRPDRDGTRLSEINQSRLQADKIFTELQSLLGDHPWTADFDKMIIEDDVNSLDIRRISTHSSVMSKSKMATVYEWYFKDECDNWIKYGQTNTASEADRVPNITSDELEIQFTREKVKTCDFQSERHEYTIDFQKMIQTNKKTLASRQVRRRTKIRPIKGAYDTRKAIKDSTLPSYWEHMDDNDIVKLFDLSPTDPEYKKNSVLINKTMRNCNIIEMKRVQNPYLWNAYVNKKKYIEKKNRSGKVHEEYLFHGTDVSNISSICEQNLDWRLHGSNVGQKFGRGSYFSNSARFTDQYSRESHGSKMVLIVKVLVGSCVVGNSLLTRPPKNSATGDLHDTTVDNEQSPKIFVKYDNQEYYPEYVVKYR